MKVWIKSDFTGSSFSYSSSNSYLGYVGSSIIFSSSLAALVCNYVNKDWAGDVKKWTLISWVFLTVGIMLGSIWAYYELGGWFWFWDPVENVSLMPGYV